MKARALLLNYILSRPQRVFRARAIVISNSDASSNRAVSKSATDHRRVSSGCFYSPISIPCKLLLKSGQFIHKINDNNKFSVQNLVLILPEDGLCGWLIFVFLWTSEITILVGLFPSPLICVCWHSILFILDKVSHWLVWASSIARFTGQQVLGILRSSQHWDNSTSHDGQLFSGC